MHTGITVMTLLVVVYGVVTLQQSQVSPLHVYVIAGVAYAASLATRYWVVLVEDKHKDEQHAEFRRRRQLLPSRKESTRGQQ